MPKDLITESMLFSKLAKAGIIVSIQEVQNGIMLLYVYKEVLVVTLCLKIPS